MNEMPDEYDEIERLVKASFECKLAQRKRRPSAEVSLLTPALRGRLMRTIHEDFKLRQAVLNGKVRNGTFNRLLLDLVSQIWETLKQNSQYNDSQKEVITRALAGFPGWLLDRLPYFVEFCDSARLRDARFREHLTVLTIESLKEITREDVAASLEFLSGAESEEIQTAIRTLLTGAILTSVSKIIESRKIQIVDKARKKGAKHDVSKIALTHKKT